VPRLVALDLPGGQTFIEALKRCFDAGDAVWPVDQRLPIARRAELVAALRPGAVIASSGRLETLEGGIPTEDGDALVVATSGTTGAPKGVVLTHAAVAASAQATSERLGVDPTTDRWLCCLPVAHVGGLSVITRALASGTPVEAHPGFDADAVRDALRRGATLVSLVPTALLRLGSDAEGFRTIVLGGSAITVDRPANAVATYGLTESGSGVVYDGLPLRDVEIDITATGEVRLRAPMLLRAYRDGTDPRDADGFFPTGDAGRLDADGRLQIAGRIAEVIVTGGEKVWPTPVEAILERLPGVTEVAVVGVPDPEWGARVVAYLVCPDRELRPSLEACRAAVRAELEPWAAPREIVFLDELPRTAIGKVRRSELVGISSR
jgi:o-succinylbenzoate---CoA ligase